MDILYLLIPLSVVLMLAIMGVFAWALSTGQFDDIEAEGARILVADAAVLDEHQGRRGTATEQSGFSISDKREYP